MGIIVISYPYDSNITSIVSYHSASASVSMSVSLLRGGIVKGGEVREGESGDCQTLALEIIRNPP